MKRWVLLVFAVVLLAPVFVATQNKPSRVGKRQEAQQPNPPIPVNVNCNCAAQTDESKDKPQGWHKLVTWPEGVATWALMLTLAAIVWQAREARRAILLGLRPQLVIRGIAVSDEGDKGWQVECQIANVGGSKAKLTESNLTINNLGITAEDRLPTFPPYGTERRWLGKCKVMPAEHKRVKIALGMDDSAFLLSFLRAARQEGANVMDTLYCFGFIQYRDRLRVQRRTAFCLHYNSVVERFERIDGKRAENYDYAD